MFAVFDVEGIGPVSFVVRSFRETAKGWGSAIMFSSLVNGGKPIHAVIKREDIGEYK